MQTFSYRIFLFLIVLSSSQIVIGQTDDLSVTDFDGNVYNTVTIGNQVWLKENIKSTHYSDGTEIPEVVSYDNSSSNANIYGRLYTWNAAMKNSTEEKTQGVCPCGWHVPSDEEWKELENYLGGADVAGGKMKEEGFIHWKLPNTDANNSSGFTALPAGEYDAHDSPNQFRLLKQYAVFWTSTEVSLNLARERYLSYSDAASAIFDWYKVMKYSVRCIKDSLATDMNNENTTLPISLNLYQNYPNPFNPTTKIEYTIPNQTNVKIKVFDVLGNDIATLVDERKSVGNYELKFDATQLPSGIYFYQMITDNFNQTKKMILIR
ncbi:MAG: FISUMP domain-containing protein [Bacteroidota bacterium]